MPDALAPVRWSAEPGEEPAGAPIHYTAPGGWLIVHQPSDVAPDRPWLLRLHGRRRGRFHTLRIAKSAPSRPELLDPDPPEGYRYAVTRDYDHQHLAPTHHGDRPVQYRDRHFTVCMAASSWSLEAFAYLFGSMLAQPLEDLPPCHRCLEKVNR